MIKKLAKFKVISSLFLLSAVAVVAATFWAYAAVKNAGSVLILHFNNVAGIDQIGGVGELIGVGITGFVVIAINFFIAIELEARGRFLGKLLAAATFLFASLLFIGFAAIISVN